MKCPLCEKNSVEIYLKIRSYLNQIPEGLTRTKNIKVNISKCRECGLEINSKYFEGFDFKSLYTNNELYSKQNNYFVYGIYPQYSNDVREIIKKFYKKNLAVLEIGCGTGELMKVLQEDGVCIEGVEIDSNAAAIPQKKNLKVYCGEIFDQYFNNKKYDIIIGIGILEHIHEPVLFLKRVRSLLKEQGILILQFPNRDSLNARISRNTKHSWDMYTEPGHIFFYNKANLKELLKKAGLILSKTYTATILTRGKIPFLPLRIVTLEEKIKHNTQKNNILFFIYKKMLQLLDIFKMGDTNLIIVERKKKT